MLSERLLTTVVRSMADKTLALHPVPTGTLPDPVPGRAYTLYVHVPFCERLCPYCSFNRYPYREERARTHFKALREEMRLLAEKGYDFESAYIGGGTPTVDIDELCETIDYARDLFSIKEINSETNPNHLIPSYLDKLKGRIQRLSVGVQSFDNELLRQIGPLRQVRQRRGDIRAHRAGGAVLRVAERGHDLQLPVPDRGHPRQRLREDRHLRVSSDHLLAPVPVQRHHAQDGERAGEDGLRPGAPLLLHLRRDSERGRVALLRAAHPVAPSTASTRICAAARTWRWTSTPWPTRSAWEWAPAPSRIWVTTCS